jgi:iron complex outermembrane receptor protein
MQIPSSLKCLATSTILVGTLAVLALPASAQEANQSAPAALSEVVVTGSRIPQPNTEAISPIQSVNQQEFKLQGTVDVETLLNNLPSVSPAEPWYWSMAGACHLAMRRSPVRI